MSSSLIRTLQHGSLYALLLLLPFSKASVEISFGLLLISWLIERFSPTTRAETVWCSPRLRPLAWAIGIYLLVCAVSVVVSDVPSLSLRGLVRKWLEYLVYCLIVADLCVRPGVAKQGFWLVAWSCAAVILSALVQEVELFRVVSLNAAFQLNPPGVYRRMTGPYENPIDLATYFIVVIPLLLGLAWRQRGYRRAALWALLALSVACVIRTASLGALIGLGIGLLAMAVAWVGIRRVTWPALGGVVVIGLLLRRVGLWRVTGWSSDIGLSDRLAMWQAALGMIRDRPLLGHGVNTFMANYLRYWVSGEQAPRYAHNCYLQMAAEIGLIGLLSFVGLLAMLFGSLVSGIRRATGDDKALLIGLLGGLLAFAAQSAVDTNFYALRQAALFWVLSGVAVGLSART